MAKKRIDKDTFLTECKAHILKHAGPFCEFTDDAAAQLDTYLAEEEVEAGAPGKLRTRLGWSASESFKDAFFRRLALIGSRAMKAADRRMDIASAAGRATLDVGALHLSDLESAEEEVAKISGTSGCTPGDGG